MNALFLAMVVIPLELGVDTLMDPELDAVLADPKKVAEALRILGITQAIDPSDPNSNDMKGLALSLVGAVVAEIDAASETLRAPIRQPPVSSLLRPTLA
ncbi:MAG: hypothetical protein V4467_04300 [Patescibacteria group bacterium]